MKRLKQFAHFVLIQCLLLATVPAAGGEVFSTTYYHNDALGSPVAASDENGNLLWREEYRPYGDRVQNDPAAEDNSRWYTGHPHDQETGLTYAGARYYDPIIGRFMAIDPVGFMESNPTSFNRYAYANNNPYKYVDPNGEAGTLTWCLGGPWGCAIGASLAIVTIIYGIHGTNEALQNNSIGTDDILNFRISPSGGTGDPCASGLCEDFSGESVEGFSSFERARNAALQELGEIDPVTRRPVIGRLGVGKDKVVGFETRVDGVMKRFRIDYDPKKGAHINIEIGKGASRIKKAFKFPGSEKDVSKLLKRNS